MSYPVMLGAVVLTSSNNVLRFTEAASTNNATIAAGTYYLRGDGAAGDLCLAIKTALEAAAVASANTYTVTVAWSIDPAVAGARITITRATGADNFGVLWADAATTFDESLLGFSANDAVNATAKTSTKSCAATWVCNDVAREIEPFSERVVAVPRAVSGRVQGVTRSARMQSWRLGLAFVDERRTFVEHALAGPQDTLEGFLERFGAGASLELHEAQVSSGTTLAALSSSTLVDVAHFTEETLTTYEPTRLGPGVPLYSLDLRLHGKV